MGLKGSNLLDPDEGLCIKTFLCAFNTVWIDGGSWGWTTVGNLVYVSEAKFGSEVSVDKVPWPLRNL